MRIGSFSLKSKIIFVNLEEEEKKETKKNGEERKRKKGGKERKWRGSEMRRGGIVQRKA